MSLKVPSSCKVRLRQRLRRTEVGAGGRLSGSSRLSSISGGITGAKVAGTEGHLNLPVPYLEGPSQMEIQGREAARMAVANSEETLHLPLILIRLV